ncbi:hypothetical protein KJ693_06660 [bacterium]|nr:hypothetical protein [bacterium]MBU1614982.1 hypothetical protein [bacterium]
MKRFIDLLTSYVFVFLSLFIGAYSLKEFYEGDYILGFVAVLATIYTFGLACMGFDRLSSYLKGGINASSSSQRS